MPVMRFLKKYLIFFLLLFCTYTLANIAPKDSIQQVLNKIAEAKEKIKLLNDLAWKLRVSDPATAILYCKQADSLATLSGNKVDRAQSMSNLGSIYNRIGNYAEALNYDFKALKIYEALNDQKGLAAVYNNIGIVYQTTNKLAMAQEFYAKALAIREKLDNKTDLAKTYNNIGIVCQLQKKLDEAEDYLLKSTAIRQQLGDSSELVNAYTNLGSLYQDMGKLKPALSYSQRALRMSEQMGNKWGMSIQYNNIGSIYAKLGDYPKSIAAQQTSLALAKELGDKEGMKYAYADLSAVYEKTKDIDHALFYYKQLSNIKDTLQNEVSSKQMAELQTQYETEKKQKAIALLEKDKKIKTVINYTLFVGLLLAFVVVFFILKLYKDRGRANLILSQQKVIIEQKNKDITDSITYAKRIQSAMLPHHRYISAFLNDYFIFYRPKDIVSGDFYWIHKKDNDVYIAVADCTGHGVPGAFMSMIGNDLLNKIIIEKQIDKPGEVLSILSKEVKESLKQSEYGSTDGMDIILCKIPMANNDENRILEYAGAHRPLYIWNNKELKEIRADKTAIGGHTPIDYVFTTKQINYNHGDMLFLFSDGYVDQFGGAKGKKFMTKKLKEILAENAGKTGREQQVTIEHIFDEWKGPHEQVDDVLLMGIRV